MLSNGLFFSCDTETLKKQASQQNAEYGRLADEHNKAVSYWFTIGTYFFLSTESNPVHRRLEPYQTRNQIRFNAADKCFFRPNLFLANGFPTLLQGRLVGRKVLSIRSLWLSWTLDEWQQTRSAQIIPTDIRCCTKHMWEHLLDLGSVLGPAW